MSKYEDRKAVEAALMLKDYCDSREGDIGCEGCVFYKGERYAGRVDEPACAVGKEPWDTPLKPIKSKFKELHDINFESEKGE